MSTNLRHPYCAAPRRPTRIRLRTHGIKDTIGYDRIIGCPHEEGIDYPIGRVCPQCPFWAGIDRFTHEPIAAPVATMSPDPVLFELGTDRSTHPLEALASADAHRGVLVQPLLDALDPPSRSPSKPRLPGQPFRRAAESSHSAHFSLPRGRLSAKP